MENNLEKKEYFKQYYEKNKVQMNAKLGAKEECPHCKSTVRHQFMKKHQQSKKCKNICSKNTCVNLIKNVVEEHPEQYDLLQLFFKDLIITKIC
jgi:hypothetical protein